MLERRIAIMMVTGCSLEENEEVKKFVKNMIELFCVRHLSNNATRRK